MSPLVYFVMSFEPLKIRNSLLPSMVVIKTNPIEGTLEEKASGEYICPTSGTFMLNSSKDEILQTLQIECPQLHDWWDLS